MSKNYVTEHLSALDLLDRQTGFTVLNLGTGNRHSVAEVLQACRSICEGLPHAEYAPRRAGDPATLIAHGRKALELLGFCPAYDLRSIVSSALAWHQEQS